MLSNDLRKQWPDIVKNKLGWIYGNISLEEFAILEKPYAPKNEEGSISLARFQYLQKRVRKYLMMEGHIE